MLGDDVELTSMVPTTCCLACSWQLVGTVQDRTWSALGEGWFAEATHGDTGAIEQWAWTHGCCSITITLFSDTSEQFARWWVVTTFLQICSVILPSKPLEVGKLLCLFFFFFCLAWETLGWLKYACTTRISARSGSPHGWWTEHGLAYL